MSVVNVISSSSNASNSSSSSSSSSSNHGQKKKLAQFQKFQQGADFFPATQQSTIPKEAATAASTTTTEMENKISNASSAIVGAGGEETGAPAVGSKRKYEVTSLEPATLPASAAAAASFNPPSEDGQPDAKKVKKEEGTTASFSSSSSSAVSIDNSNGNNSQASSILLAPSAVTAEASPKPKVQNKIDWRILTKPVLKDILKFSKLSDYKSGEGGKVVWASVDLEKLAKYSPNVKYELRYGRLTHSTPNGLDPYGLNYNQSKKGFRISLSAKDKDVLGTPEEHQEMADYKDWAQNVFDPTMIELLYENQGEWQISSEAGQVPIEFIRMNYLKSGKNGFYRLPRKGKDKKDKSQHVVLDKDGKPVKSELGDCFSFAVNKKPNTEKGVSLDNAPLEFSVFQATRPAPPGGVLAEVPKPIDYNSFKVRTEYDPKEKVDVTKYTPFYGSVLCEFKGLWFVNEGYGPHMDAVSLLTYADPAYRPKEYKQQISNDVCRF